MADWPITLTSFGDVHYFYGPPTNNPPHHRFDKGSYVYLFENANDRRARIEIANQPGTDDQDAFDGFLDQTHVRYSYNHQCMVTLTVGETSGQSEWHLPTYDPHNQNKYHYKLHSLDIYFWKQEDALQFVNGIRRVLPPTQVEILDEPVSPSHHHHQQADPVSAVVQQLEHAAVSDPTYGTSQQKPPGGAALSMPGALGFPGPPTSAVPAQQQSAPPASFVPMAYNPAAPAAPEAIRHREKTPPPEDDGVDPLAAAVAYDAQAPFSPGFVPPPGFQSGQLGGAGLPPPPPPPQQFGAPQPGLQRAATMPVQAVHGGLASPGLTSPYGGQFPGTPGLPPPPPPQQQPPQQQQQATPQPQQQQQQPTPPPSSTSQSTPPVTSPGGPAPPAGGYSQYSYGNQQQPAVVDYSVHSQVYRPTEQEAAKYKGYMVKPEPAGKLEQNAGRLERGVSGMLKKFEKKFG
ncbi:RNA recognition motif-containing protein [Colletotrichum sojae]|uniref:RNA recognition motif-containing protein n=1 Tax=Colletotrichum sojae TaxID=2175907 RepID=A0A8H6JEQ4_9PEZI|nr:RNA recognition motif-containing protein [Colletotrichum sojae]